MEELIEAYFKSPESTNYFGEVIAVEPALDDREQYWIVTYRNECLSSGQDTTEVYLSDLLPWIWTGE